MDKKLMRRLLPFLLACLLVLLPACSRGGAAGPSASIGPSVSVQPTETVQPDQTGLQTGRPQSSGDASGSSGSGQTASPGGAGSASPSPSAGVEPTATVAAQTSDIAEEVVYVKAVGFNDELMLSVELPADRCSTAYDAIKLACEQSGVAIATRGTGGMTYIVSIGGLAEKDKGPLSGWVYKVNGVMGTVGAASCEVNAGDRVSFYYTLDLGKDVADKD